MMTTLPLDTEIRLAPLRGRRRSALWALACAALTSVAALAALRSPGPGLQYDGVVYLSTARQLVEGGRLAIPYAVYPFSAALPNDSMPGLTHWPPGYPLAIASLHASGLPLVDSARAVQAASAALTVGVLVFLIAEAASLTAALLCAGALLVTPFVVEHNAQLFSEPLFIALVVLTVAGMVFRPHRPLLYGALAALAVATRYLGLGVALGCAVWALLAGGSLVERARRAALALLPSILFLVGWALYGSRTATPHRPVHVWTAGFASTLYRGVATIGRCLIPETAVASPRWTAVAVAAILIVLAPLVLPMARNALRSVLRGVLPASDRARLGTALASMVLSCLGTLVATRLMVDPNVVMDGRVMTPIIVLSEAALTLALWAWARRASPAARALAAVALVAWTVAAVTSSAQRLAAAPWTGFAERRWRESNTVAWVRDSGSGSRIFTNQPPPLYLYAGRSSRLLPSGDEAGNAVFRRAVDPRGDIIVYFYEMRAGKRVGPRVQWVPSLHLDTLAELSDGIVVRPSAAPLGPPRPAEEGARRSVAWRTAPPPD